MKNIIKRIITALGLTTAFLGLYLYFPPFYFSLILMTILLEIIIFEWPQLFDYRALVFWLVLPFYPVLPFALLISLNQWPIYRPLVLILFMSVAFFDTGSYLVGKILGMRKLAPAISPGKTWEGFWGGALVSFASLAIYTVVYKASIAWPQLMLVSFAISIISLCGDLFVSWLKRHAGIKDTGALLPGHGGLLDRFDALLSATLFFFVFKNYLITLFN